MCSGTKIVEKCRESDSPGRLKAAAAFLIICNLARFLKQSWLCQSAVILFALVLLYLFSMYGPGLRSADFIYYNF